MNKWIYRFGPNLTDGKRDMKDILGGKGANLAEMCLLHLPVPPGMTISTEACQYYYSSGKLFPPGLLTEVYAAIADIESQAGCVFGSDKNPLLFSVRSGSRNSMPGMMDTILNLGLNDRTTHALAKITGNPVFALDSYRRFIQMFSSVVLKVDHHLFESVLSELKKEKGYSLDNECNEADMQQIVSGYHGIVVKKTGLSFPQDVHDQLELAIAAVFQSWMNPRAITYREMYKIPAEWGTAVNIQSMVFGNKGNNSATGVVFSRDPSTGDTYLYGEYLLNAQGEDVVAGIRTPQQVSIAGKKNHPGNEPSLEELMPATYSELLSCARLLERHNRDLQDIEFTIEDGKLWILQTRNGKRSAAAAVRIAVDMVNEEIISKKEAVLRVPAEDINQLLHPAIDRNSKYAVIAKGLAASPGAVTGKLVLDALTAANETAKGEAVILARYETSPEDIGGMKVAKGIITARGGMTSHAAVVARGMGKPCITGINTLYIDEENNRVRFGEHVFNAGDILTMDGGSGEVIPGIVPTREAFLFPELKIFLSWCDEFRTLKIRANADTPADCTVAREWGAAGIGLCRTEHMFFDPERILIFRKMIFASDVIERKEILTQLIGYQRDDFEGIFTVMSGLPVTIRLLDPPLHEFLPHSKDDIIQLANACNVTSERLQQKMDALRESNPMLGHRGCRLAITYPEIYTMQVRAIIEAAIAVQRKGIDVHPEIMVPLVIHSRELILICKMIRQTVLEVCTEQNTSIDYLIGTMIELPRAALTAAGIAAEVAFFSFGTNDLTQTTLGISRDDSSLFMESYLEQGIFSADPFEELDEEGVGKLISACIREAKEVKPSLKTGICGEHGGNPVSIRFFHNQHFDYVSCSPYRLPVARVAAAQEALLD